MFWHEINHWVLNSMVTASAFYVQLRKQTVKEQLHNNRVIYPTNLHLNVNKNVQPILWWEVKNTVSFWTARTVPQVTLSIRWCQCFHHINQQYFVEYYHYHSTNTWPLNVAQNSLSDHITFLKKRIQKGTAITIQQ